MPAADTADGQLADRQLIADPDRPPRRAQLGGGLRVGIQQGIGVGFPERRQPRGVGVVRVLVGDQNRRQPGNALESVRKVTGIKEQAGFAELRE